MTQQAKGGYRLLQDGGLYGSPVRQAKRVEDHPDDERATHIAQERRGDICRPGAQERGQTIRVDLSKQRR